MINQSLLLFGPGCNLNYFYYFGDLPQSHKGTKIFKEINAFPIIAYFLTVKCRKVEVKD
jgi:hypothetical protein